MPFNKDRNSRDDSPKRPSKRGEAKFSKDKKFGQKEDGGRPRRTGDTERKFKPTDSRERKTSYDDDRRSDFREAGAYGKKKDFTGKADSRDRRFKATDSREQRSPADRSERRFDRDERPFGKQRDFNRADGGRERKFGTGDNNDRRSFEKSERRFDRFDKPYGKKRDFDEQYSRGERHHVQKGKFRGAEKPAFGDHKDDGLIRLNRYISNAGICSRRKADELIAAGVISVNGQVVTELGTKVDPAKDDIRYNNERLKREKMVYVLLNKPKDFITTTDDPQERKTVMQLVSKATKERIYPVGRLDRNTTGLLLLTNDGNLAEKLSHPRNNISKIYNVELDRNLTQGDFNKLQFGLQLEDGFVKPDDISYVVGGGKNEVGIQIHSGKNRIVRRMFEYLGYEVVKLDRVVYGNLTKKDLPRGRWRYLEEKELYQLKNLIK